MNSRRVREDWCARIRALRAPNEGACEDVCLYAAFGYMLAHNHTSDTS